MGQVRRARSAPARSSPERSIVPLLWNVRGVDPLERVERGRSTAARDRARRPLRLVLPDLFGNPADGTWWGPFNYNATAVFAGVLALPLAWMGLAIAPALARSSSRSP